MAATGEIISQVFKGVETANLEKTCALKRILLKNVDEGVK